MYINRVYTHLFYFIYLVSYHFFYFWCYQLWSNKDCQRNAYVDYAKHGKLVDTDASGTKASTKQLESRSEIIQGHAFRDHWRADQGLRILYNNVGLNTKVYKQIASKNAENCRRRQSQCRLTPFPKEAPRKSALHLNYPETTVECYWSIALIVYYFSRNYLCKSNPLSLK